MQGRRMNCSMMLSSAPRAVAALAALADLPAVAVVSMALDRMAVSRAVAVAV
jgi:hypothetical protein